MKRAMNKLRIAIGLLMFEGNSQSPVLTTLDDFSNIMLAEGNDVIDIAKGTRKGRVLKYPGL